MVRRLTRGQRLFVRRCWRRCCVSAGGCGDPDPRRSDRGYLRGRADGGVAENFERLVPYHDEARKNGTTLENAVRDYAEVESRFRRNPVDEVIYAAQRLGIDPRQLVAAAYQQLYGQNGNQYQQQAAHRFAVDGINRDIAAFRADPANKYFDHVRMDMARLVQSGRAKDLKSAYRLALRNNAQLRVMEKMEKLDAQRDRDKARPRGYATYGGY